MRVLIKILDRTEEWAASDNEDDEEVFVVSYVQCAIISHFNLCFPEFDWLKLCCGRILGCLYMRDYLCTYTSTFSCISSM